MPNLDNGKSNSLHILSQTEVVHKRILSYTHRLNVIAQLLIVQLLWTWGGVKDFYVIFSVYSKPIFEFMG